MEEEEEDSTSLQESVCHRGHSQIDPRISQTRNRALRVELSLSPCAEIGAYVRVKNMVRRSSMQTNDITVPQASNADYLSHKGGEYGTEDGSGRKVSLTASSHHDFAPIQLSSLLAS